MSGTTSGCCTAWVKVTRRNGRQHPVPTLGRRLRQSRCVGRRRDPIARWPGPRAARPGTPTRAAPTRPPPSAADLSTPSDEGGAAPNAPSDRRSRNGASSGQSPGKGAMLVEHLGAGEVVAGERDADRERVRQIGQHDVGARVEGVGALAPDRRRARRERRRGGKSSIGAWAHGLLAGREVDDGLVEEGALLTERDPQCRGHGGRRPRRRPRRTAVLLRHLLGRLRRREVALRVLGVDVDGAGIGQRLPRPRATSRTRPASMPRLERITRCSSDSPSVSRWRRSTVGDGHRLESEVAAATSDARSGSSGSRSLLAERHAVAGEVDGARPHAVGVPDPQPWQRAGFDAQTSSTSGNGLPSSGSWWAMLPPSSPSPGSTMRLPGRGADEAPAVPAADRLVQVEVVGRRRVLLGLARRDVRLEVALVASPRRGRRAGPAGRREHVLHDAAVEREPAGTARRVVRRRRRSR